MEFDVVIRQGSLYDGSGNPPQRGDVGVVGDRVRAIGILREAAARVELNASGMAVAPGFIDVHAHSDVASFLQDADLSLRTAPLLQGVTTEVSGNCGFSPFPFRPAHRDDLGQQGAVVFGQIRQRWPGLRNYVAEVAAQGLFINLAPLVGHGSLRAGTVGTMRAIGGAQLTNMNHVLSETLAEGAFGLSTGLIYAPGVFADREELVLLAKTAARFGRPYVSHIRSETNSLLEAVDEAIGIGRSSGAAIHISHHKAAGRENWGRTTETLERIAHARNTGVDISVDVYPYTSGSTLLSALLPSWLHEGGAEGLLTRLADRASRERIERAFTEPGWENLVRAAGWSGISIASCPGKPEFEGHTLAALAEDRGGSAADFLFDLLLEQRGAVLMNLRLMDEADVRNVLAFNQAMIGSDGLPVPGKPHPRLSGTFVRILSRYVREERALDLPSAVRKMTGLPAQRFALRGRGELAVGAYADIVVFDPATVADQATFDDPLAAPVGVRHVLVNGALAVRDGTITGARAGGVLTPH